MNKVVVFLFCLIFSGVATNVCDAKTIVLQSPSENYRDIEFQEFRGLPRFGILDTSGFMSPQASSMAMRNKINSNKSKAEKIGSEIEKHNYSIGLLIQLDFMNKYSDCFKNMKGYEIITEKCDEMLINHASQKDFWKKYIEIMSFSLKPQAHIDQFCSGESSCTITSIARLFKRISGGRAQVLDEFEKRDFVSALMTNQYDAFEKYWKNMKFPKEAYWVSTIHLGDYDFDQEKFTFFLTPSLNLISQNVFGGVQNSAVNSRSIKRAVVYAPSASFEKEFKEKMNSGISRFMIDLPMSKDKAKLLVQGENKNRVYYAVVRVKFLDPKLGPYNPLSLMNTLSYHYSENMVELYEDDSLTKQVAQVPIVHFSSKDPGKKDKDDVAKYIFSPKNHFLDYISLSLLRFRKEDIMSKDMDRISYSVSSGERSLWREHTERLKRASLPISSSANAEQQERLKNQKKMAIDRSKISHFSWQDIKKLSSTEKKAFYNYMLGYDYLKEGAISWPGELSSVNWGMNLVTVFRKDYFLGKEKGLNDSEDEETRGILQKFLRDIANAQDLKKLILVYPLEAATYDQKNKNLVFNQNKWPLRSMKNIVFSDEKTQENKPVNSTLVSSLAKGRAVYRLQSSLRGIGSWNPNPSFRSCTHNQQKKSYDCMINHTSFAQLTFENSYLALDRKIMVDKVSLPLKKGLSLMKNNSYLGWRLVVELANPDMDVTKYDYVHRQTRKNVQGEVRTLLVDVDRVLILSPNDEIVWSKNGKDFPSIEKLLKEASVVKKNVELDLMAKTQLTQAIQQCEIENINQQNIFKACETLRADFVKEEENLELARQNKCNKETVSTEDVSSKISQVKGPCKYSPNMDVSMISLEIKKCIMTTCGQINLLMAPEKYKSCVENVQEQAKIIMEKMMTSIVQTAHQVNLNTCDQPQRKVSDIKAQLMLSKCSLYTEKPVLKKCK